MTRIPADSDLALIEGVLAEPGSGGDRLILWIFLGRDGRDRLWERVASVVGAEVTEMGDVRSIPAKSYQSRQRDQGAIGRTIGGMIGRSADRGWAPRGGGEAKRTSERRADLVLAWSTDVDNAEARVRARWSGSEEIRRVGAAMFVVSGIGASSSPSPESANPSPELGSPTSREQAEALLEVARRAGDRRGEAAAMTDLGITQIQLGQTGQAVELLEKALGIYRELKDLASEVDVASPLGSALIATGQVARGLAMLEEALAGNVKLGDRFAEKLTLERLGMAFGSLGDSIKALAYFDRAIALSRALGDRHQEATLLWRSAIRLAELGRRDEAIGMARASVEGLVAQGNPKAAWYAEHLERYRSGQSAASLPGPPDLAASTASSGPGVLKMALSAGKAMAAFLGSGMKKTAPEIHRDRLAICEACEHHTGLRCRLCGCFTAAKAWLPYEVCPIGRWPELVKSKKT
jgi:tetratricopeptide (TPR) repeat protein